MKNRLRYFGLFVGFILIAPTFLTAEDRVLQVHLFQGDWTEDQTGLKAITILTESSHPLMATLKTKASASQDELTAATLEFLVEALDLKTVDDLFAFTKTWDGSQDTISTDILHKQALFQFIFNPRRLSSNSMELKVVLYKSRGALLQRGESMEKDLGKALMAARKEGQMEKILDTELRLEVGNPVIAGMPSGKGAFFMMILLTSGNRISRPTKSAETKYGAQAVTVKPPKPVHTIMPAYPEELRRQGVKGQVELEASIDEEGLVIGVKITKSLHPYLDFAAVQALRQWKYEPVIHEGKSVRAIVTLEVNFDPEAYRLFEEKAREQEGLTAGKAPSAENSLRKILDQSAAYCLKLTGAALDFICEEKIKEIHYYFGTEHRWAGLAVSPKGGPVSTTWIPMWDPERTEKNDFVCDYLFVKKGDSIEERRIILKDSGQKMPDRNKLLEEKRFTSLNPVLAATQLLDRDRQPMFNYRLIDNTKVNGRQAFVIEAVPKSGNTRGVEYAKIWIDQERFQVLKSEIEGVPLEGYEDVLRDATLFDIKPILTTTHFYELEIKGVLFPDRSTIRVDYPKPGNFLYPKRLKLKVDMTYKKYKFFTVEVEHQLIKQDGESYF